MTQATRTSPGCWGRARKGYVIPLGLKKEKRFKIGFYSFGDLQGGKGLVTPVGLQREP